MRLIDLEGELIAYRARPAGPHHGRTRPDGTTQWGGFPTETHIPVQFLGNAGGVTFLCPLCYAKAGERPGVHSVQVTFAGRDVPDEYGSRGEDGKPTRWAVSGTGLHDLRTDPSIQLVGGCNWHGFIGHVAPGVVSTC